VTAPAPPRVSWRYTFCDLLTRRALARLPLVDADLSEVIGGPADGTGRIPLTADSVRAADPWAATLQRRTVCFAQRIVTTGDLVVAAPCLWAGIVWKRVRSGTSLTLTMSTVESYWSYRLAGDRTFTATDDATILRTVLADAEATPTGRLGITLGTSLLGATDDATSASIGPDELAAGYPLLEMALNSSTQDLTWQATLDAHTRSALAAMRAGETRITSLTVRGDRGPTTDTYGLGDTVSVNLNDPLQQTPRTLRGRVLSRKIEPVQPGRTERVAMTLGLVA
jgi:hypothetical protein